MTSVFRHASAALVFLAAMVLLADPASAQAPAPPLPATRDVQALQEGNAAFDQARYPDAIKAYEGLIRNFPNLPTVPEALFRLGYAYYFTGEYDKSVENLQKAAAAKGALPEVVELALVLTPQVLAAKAAKLPADDPARRGTLEQAVKGFDAYLVKFPSSDEAETANYGKALALYQLGRYEQGADALRKSIQRFAQSETIQESQYLLALTIGTIANVALEKSAEKGSAPDPSAEPAYTQAEALLRDIINKRQNLALANDAQFQIGELLFRRGGFLEDDKEEEKQKEIYQRALEAYRAVQPKETVLQVQKQRLASFDARRQQAGIAKDQALFKRLGRIKERELEKLAQIEGREDQTLSTKLKNGQIFFQLGKMDEARVLLSYIEPQAQDAEMKKQVSYFIALTYALQAAPAKGAASKDAADKAIARYEAFNAAFKGDPLGQNLPLIVGSMFLSEDPDLNDPEKAIQFFKGGIELFPKGKYAAQMLIQQAFALGQLERYDEAIKVFQDFLAKNPPKDLAAAAEFGLATIYKDTDKTADAIKTFRAVRDKYVGTPQAVQSAYWAGQLLLGSDPKAASSELQSFAKNFPESNLLPQAAFALGQAQTAAGETDAALATFKEIPAKFAKSAPAPFSYFERAKIHMGKEKFDEVLKTMREFIEAYPESESQYQAYDFMAQIHTNQGRNEEAVKTYEEFVAKRPKDPNAAEALVKLSSLWKGYAEGLGAPYTMNDAKRAEWKKDIEGSIAAAEKVLQDYPDSPAGALALQNLLSVQKMQLRAKDKADAKTDADITTYFLELAKKNEAKPDLKSKIIFTLASFTFEKDKAKAVEQMSGAYQADLKYAPDDLDLYGLALIEAKKYDEAIAVYDKLAKDYPNLANVDPTKAPRTVQEAQSIALFGIGKALQGQGKSKEGAEKFAQLEKHYGWSKKKQEVNYGIATQLHTEKKDEDAMKRLFEVIKAREATPVLRANSMLLLGQIHEANGRHGPAIDNYIKISALFTGVPDAASEGLWRGAQLLEKQASGELPMPTPAAKPADGPKVAAQPSKKSAQK